MTANTPTVDELVAELVARLAAGQDIRKTENELPLLRTRQREITRSLRRAGAGFALYADRDGV